MVMCDAPRSSSASEPGSRWKRALFKLTHAFSGNSTSNRQRRASSSEAESKLRRESFGCSTLAGTHTRQHACQEQPKSRRHSDGSFWESRITYIPVSNTSTPLAQLPEQSNAVTVDWFTNLPGWVPGNLPQAGIDVRDENEWNIVTPDFSRPQHGVPSQHPGLAEPADPAQAGAVTTWSPALSSALDGNPQQVVPSQHPDAAKSAADASEALAGTARPLALRSSLDGTQLQIIPSWIATATAQFSIATTATLQWQAAQHRHKKDITPDDANMSQSWIQEVVSTAQREQLTPAEAAVTFDGDARLSDLGDELDSLAILPLVNPYEEQAAAGDRVLHSCRQNDCELVLAL